MKLFFKGRLWSADRNSPLIVVVTHYDTHSAVPGLSVGADSNGSGVAALLELLAIFSRFYGSVSFFSTMYWVEYITITIITTLLPCFITAIVFDQPVELKSC